MNKSIAIILTCGMVVAARPDFAMAQFQMLRHVIGNGNTATTNLQFQIQGTVGQSALGLGSNVNHIHQSGYWNGLDFVTSVEQIPSSVPEVFRLDQNYPNPFNPETTIHFAVPNASHVSIKLYDVRGRQVATLLDERMTTGQYKLRFAAADLPSGVYFYRMIADGFVQSRKLTLVK